MRFFRRNVFLIVFLVPAALFAAIVVYGVSNYGVRPRDMTKYHVTARSLEAKTVRGLAVRVEVHAMDEDPRLFIELRSPKADAGKSLSLWLVDTIGNRLAVRLAPIELDKDGHRDVERRIPPGTLQRYNRLIGKAGKRTVLVASLS